MSGTNQLRPGAKGASVAVGREAVTRAGAGPLLFKHADGTEYLAWKVRAPAVIEIEEGEEVQLGGEGSGSFTNDTGGGLEIGDVVVLSGDTVITTTTPQDTRPVGVVTMGGADGDPILVQFFGPVAYVRVTAAVTAGAYAETSTTAGAATENSTRRTGSFGIYLTAGTTPSVMLFGIPDATEAASTGSYDPIVVVTAGAAQTLDLAEGRFFDVTLTDDCTLTFSNAPEPAQLWQYLIAIRQGGAGSYTVTWPASVLWADDNGLPTGTAPTLFTAIGAQNDFLLSTVDGGTTYGASMLGGAGAATTRWELAVIAGSPPDSLYASGDWLYIEVPV